MHSLENQAWERDIDRPCLSLGTPGSFDDAHIFAPCVACENGRYFMWYCGSSGTVPNRVFRLGLAISDDGVHFSRETGLPVLRFADGQRSVLTPALLRRPDGSVCRENGRLRMWFSACNFPAGDGLHSLHEASSPDGRQWTHPSESELQGVYAPTIIKEDKAYKMWYTDVGTDPWCIRYAESDSGSDWRVSDRPALVLDQEWEHTALFYPTVLKSEGLYLMWYGSYSSGAEEEMKTALGFALSPDGRNWKKTACNPVFGPDPSRAWESHYTTSQSVLRLRDGAWRIWYASRPKPPFEHKYYAIGTAKWEGAGFARPECSGGA